MKDIIQSKHYSIYLKASIPTLAARLKEEKSFRPLITHLKDDATLTEYIGKHLFERNVFYQEANCIYYRWSNGRRDSGGTNKYLSLGKLSSFFPGKYYFNMLV